MIKGLSQKDHAQLSALGTSLNEQYPKESDLRVWHIPQVPGTAFHVAVSTPVEGFQVLRVLAAYDAFQLVNRIKPDYASAQGLECFEDGEWCEWMNEDGADIRELSLVAGELVVPNESDDAQGGGVGDE